MGWFSNNSDDSSSSGSSTSKQPLRPTADAPNQGRGGVAAILANRGKSIDAAVDAMTRGEDPNPPRSAYGYKKGGKVPSKSAAAAKPKAPPKRASAPKRVVRSTRKK